MPYVNIDAFSDGDVPSGAINGSNKVFTLLHTPTPAASLILVLNGITLKQGVDYTLVGQTITYSLANAPNNAPQSGDSHEAWYRYTITQTYLIPGLTFVDWEVPTGAINGSNTVFGLAYTPNPAASVVGYVRQGGAGAFLPMVNGVDFTVSGSTVTCTAAPATNSNLYFSYRY